jgi:hypothetical protein
MNRTELYAYVAATLAALIRKALQEHAASHGGWTFTCDECMRLTSLIP